MSRFHRHDDTAHEHPAEPGHDHEHGHDHDHHHDHAAGPAHGLGDHSGYATGPERIEVLERIFDENDAAADRNRTRLEGAGVVAVNLMSSPGAGKTSVLERTLAALAADRVGVIEGYIETSIDADRLAAAGARVSLLNTANGFGGECHLDAPMVAHALDRLDLDGLDLLFIENVGNLVCPAEFDVGAHHSAMVYAITEGEEKPLKYPVMFRAAEVVLVNKLDLLPYLDFDLDLFERNLARVNPAATVIRLSARSGSGFEAWLAWLAAEAPATAIASAASRGTPRADV